ncbi:ArsR/SmtB family transcription factor [Enhygromyxa salina]|nr:metalloregulator ArsR/SmtB family transcription factor [Enhygromyxa salina]
MPSRPRRGSPRLTVLASSAAATAAECTPRRRAKARDLRPYMTVFKALGDATRVEIVALLAEAREPVCACDIEGHFELAQATVSHHLKILREAGVLASERRGTWIFYSLEPTALDRLNEFATLLDR